MPFSDEDRATLAPYVTSADDDVFAVKNLPGMTGAIYARYSRAQGGFREVLLKEFIKEGHVDATKVQDLIERVLVAYGDDSVGELEGAHVSFENISILATKEIEDRRIGGSPIEQSTRYVFYDQKDANGNFRYYRDPAIMASPLANDYTNAMDFIFSTYCELIEPMKSFYKSLKSIDEAEYDINGDGVKEKLADLTDETHSKAFKTTYNADIRTKACDTLRALLPLATKTNVGVFGNGRFFQHVLSTCYSSAIPEVRSIAERGHDALNQIIPRFVKRAKANDYMSTMHTAMSALAHELFATTAPEKEESIVLLDHGEQHIAQKIIAAQGDVHATQRALHDENDNLMLALMLYPHLTHPLRQIRDVVRSASQDTRDRIIHTYLGSRKTRRDRPGRALEAGYAYTFDLTTDFGTYKDLERHRINSQLRQKFTPLLGFAMPADLETAGFAGRARECLERAVALYQKLLPVFPDQASYTTLHGSLTRWSLGINDRALMHMLELRTTPQGHPSYRKVCQQMHHAVATQYPWRAAAMQFTDHNDYFWSRADSEAKQRVKEHELDTKQSV